MTATSFFAIGKTGCPNSALRSIIVSILPRTFMSPRIISGDFGTGVSISTSTISPTSPIEAAKSCPSILKVTCCSPPNATDELLVFCACWLWSKLFVASTIYPCRLSLSFILVVYPCRLSLSFILVVYPCRLSLSFILVVYPCRLSLSFILVVYPCRLSLSFIVVYPCRLSLSFILVVYPCRLSLSFILVVYPCRLSLSFILVVYPCRLSLPFIFAIYYDTHILPSSFIFLRYCEYRITLIRILSIAFVRRPSRIA